MLQGRFVGLAVLFTALLAAASVEAAIVPGYSTLVATTRSGSSADFVVVTDDQNGSILPLELMHGANVEGLAIDLQGHASWTDADTGRIELRYARNDANPLGYGDVFSGELRFQYFFSVDEETEVMVSYESVGATTFGSISGAANWWAMQGGSFSVDGVIRDSASFGAVFGSAPADTPSPQTLAGAFTVLVAAGDHVFDFTVHGGALGNFPGNRSMNTVIEFQIGENLTVPLPPSALLLAPALAMLRRQVRGVG